MRAHTPPVLILRDARTLIRLCRAVGARSVGARALLRMRTAQLAARRRTVFVIPVSRCQTAILVPAARFCARGLHLCFTHPESRGGRSAEKRSGACEAPVGHAITRRVRRLARRLASHHAGRSPLGAPPWRFWAPGAALPAPWAPAVLQRRAVAFGSVQRAPRTQVVVPGGRGPCLPRPAVTSRRRRTPLPAPPSGSSPETPLNNPVA
jgi:hypothetical protein